MNYGRGKAAAASKATYLTAMRGFSIAADSKGRAAPASNCSDSGWNCSASEMLGRWNQMQAVQAPTNFFNFILGHELNELILISGGGAQQIKTQKQMRRIIRSNRSG